jgi:hypothetical protein
MTRHATDAPADMGTVIEIDVVGQIVNANPRNRFVGRHALAKRFGRLQSGGNFLMAVHAKRRWRNRGKGGMFHRRVAIPAIQAHLAGMDLMGVRHRLARRIADVGCLR